jgi:tetratricopeptide (TPR) repeat protein
VLDLWGYRAGLKDQAAEMEKALRQPGCKLAIRAPVGAGRHTLVKRLAAASGAVVLEVPSPEDLDAPLHSLVQLTTGAGDWKPEGAHDLFQCARAAAEALAAQHRVVIVLLPASRTGAPTEASTVTRDRLGLLLDALTEAPNLPLAVVALPRSRLSSKFTSTYHLDAPLIGAQQIRADELPDKFESAARELASWMAKEKRESTPLEVRLQVGLVALGERPDGLALGLEALAKKMVQQLRRWPTLERAANRLLLARRALPIASIAELSGVEPQWQPLFTHCIGYGDDEVRVPEVTRQVLLDAMNTTQGEREDAHAALARYHGALDGARSLRQLHGEPAIHWLEKVHHLALSGAQGAEQWNEQEPAGREQLWERARVLSHHRRFEEAAHVYRRCLEMFGADAYSHHYLAYNLDRSHRNLEEVRRSYEYAATAEPKNPWWQQRWVRHLIAHGTLAEARAAWQNARRSVDPDGSRLRRSAWLSLNLHYWVARRWLAVGQLEDARGVLSEIPDLWLEEEEELRRLRDLIASQEQAMALGEDVYPVSTPLEARWKTPRALRPKRAGKPLETWAPGRVVEASATEVTVVVAPTPEEAQQITYDAESWQRLAGEPAEDAAGFFELGIYEGGDEIIRPIFDDGDGNQMDLEEADLLAWMRT